MQLPNYMVTILPTLEDELAIKKLRSAFAETFNTDASNTPVQIRLIAPFIAKDEDIATLITRLSPIYSSETEMQLHLSGIATLSKGRVIYVPVEITSELKRIYNNTFSCFTKEFPHIKLTLQHKFHPQVTLAYKVPPEIFPNTTNFVAQPFAAVWPVRSIALMQKLPKHDWTTIHTFPLTEI